MSYTKQYINDLREAGLVDGFGNRLYPDLSGAGDRQPTQGANGTRINPSDVLGELRFQERRATVEDNKPVAFWFKGTARWSNPGYAYCYEQVAENNGEYRENRQKDGKKAQRWLVAHGYRIVYRSPVKGQRSDVTECWGHVRYFGEPNNPDRFVPTSVAELREYIDLAAAPEETVAPELPAEEATTQPERMDFDAAVDTLANFVGTLITEQAMAGWLA